VHQQGFYKRSLYSGGKDATIQKFKLKSLICFNSPSIRHWTSLHQTPPYLPHSSMELSNLCKVGSARWRVTNGLQNSEAKKQCLRIQPPLSSYMFAYQPIYPSTWASLTKTKLFMKFWISIQYLVGALFGGVCQGPTNPSWHVESLLKTWVEGYVLETCPRDMFCSV
jgi:hypothetical protein